MSPRESQTCQRLVEEEVNEGRTWGDLLVEEVQMFAGIKDLHPSCPHTPQIQHFVVLWNLDATLGEEETRNWLRLPRVDCNLVFTISRMGALKWKLSAITQNQTAISSTCRFGLCRGTCCTGSFPGLPLQSCCFPWRTLPWQLVLHDLAVHRLCSQSLPHCFPLVSSLSLRKASLLLSLLSVR